MQFPGGGTLDTLGTAGPAQVTHGGTEVSTRPWILSWRLKEPNTRDVEEEGVRVAAQAGCWHPRPEGSLAPISHCSRLHRPGLRRPHYTCKTSALGACGQRAAPWGLRPASCSLTARDLATR